MAKRVFLEFEHDIEAFEKKVDELRELAENTSESAVAVSIDAEVAQRLFKLQAAAADVGAGIAPQLYNGLVLDRRTGLVRFLPVDIDLAGHDERLRLASAVAQAALHENDIQSFLMLHSDIPPRQRQQEILRPTPPGGTAPVPRRGE